MMQSNTFDENHMSVTTNPKNKIYAVTGGIGSGKSTVAKIIAQKGYPVFSCDEIYKELSEAGVFSEEIKRQFGNVFFEDGMLDRKALSAIVFNDSKKLKQLNSITHNKVIDEALKRASRCEGPAFVEVQLLFEEGYEKLFSGVIVVLREKEERICSVMQRDNLSRENVIKRMNSQYDYDGNSFVSYDILYNNGSLTQLIESVESVLQKILF